MPLVRVEIHSCSIYLFKNVCFISVRNLGLAKWNVEYILKDFSEEKKIVTCSLENGSCGK